MENREKFNKNDLLEKSKAIIDANKIFFMKDVPAFIPCSRNTFNKYIPLDSKEREELDELINNNRIIMKAKIRNMLFKEGSPTSLIAFYKMIATDEERNALSKTGSFTSNADSNQVNISFSIKYAISKHTKEITKTLQISSKYNSALDFEIKALASALASLDYANKVLSKLDSPFIVEHTSQGDKIAPHPIMLLRQKSMENIATHSKILGLDTKSISGEIENDPLVELTKQLNDIGEREVVVHTQES